MKDEAKDISIAKFLKTRQEQAPLLNKFNPFQNKAIKLLNTPSNQNPLSVFKAATAGKNYGFQMNKFDEIKHLKKSNLDILKA